jgi:ketosteroid isomerase-like protein
MRRDAYVCQENFAMVSWHCKIWMVVGMWSGLVCAQPMRSQQPDSTLQATIAAQDTALFDAVNRCDMPKVATFWADDAEFLHDQSAPTFGRAAIVKSIQTNLCGKVQRELVPGTMQVYPLKDYGAVELGVHRFLHPGAQDHGVVGEAQFIHVWRHTDAGWKITRVISYEHHVVADGAAQR